MNVTNKQTSWPTNRESEIEESENQSSRAQTSTSLVCHVLFLLIFFSHLHLGRNEANTNANLISTSPTLRKPSC